MESRFNVVTVASTAGSVTVMDSGNFREFGLTEGNVEKLLASGVMLKGEIKIVGRQVNTEYGWKADLVGIRRDGTLVVIEVKRDQEDIEHRKEPCEIQVIRYAAGLMDIQTVDDVLNVMYLDFAAKYLDLSETDEALRSEAIRDDLKSWLRGIDIVNREQELVLIASGFDSGTISACHWLHHHGVVITCIQVSPFKNEEGQLLLVVDRIFPLESLQELKGRTAKRRKPAEGDRAQFMSTADMFDAGMIKSGQVVYLKGTDKTAIVSDGMFVFADNVVMRWNEWAKKHKTGSFSLYQYVCVDSAKGKTLHELRTDK